MSTSTAQQTSADEQLKQRQQQARSYSFPPQPIFSSPEEERVYRKQRLAAAFRIFGKFGYDEGVMGHISARDPVELDTFWINPLGVSFNLITTHHLMRVDLTGKVIEGDGYPHPGGIPLHSIVLSLRPDIVSVAHTHSVYGRAWTANGCLIPPVSSESAVFFERHAIYDSHAHGEGDNMVKALEGNRALLMKNHGLLTVGQSVEEAAYLFISLEKVCQSQIAAESVGPTLTLEDHQARRYSELFQAYNGWLNFQPLYQSIVKEQPDLLGDAPSADRSNV